MDLDGNRKTAELEFEQVNPLEKQKKEIYSKLEEVNEWAVGENLPSLIQDGKWVTLNIAYLAGVMFDYCIDTANDIKKAQDLTRKAREENARLKHYLKQLDGLEGYAKWLKAQKQGRKPKDINWEKYEILKKANINQKDMARLLGVSPNTLRKILKAKQ